MNIEGGVGADLLEGGLSVGVAYYWSSKLTQDHIEGLPSILIRGKNRVFALGPEATLALARAGTVYGFLKLTYLWEVYARTTTQGSAFQIAATFLVPPLIFQSREAALKASNMVISRVFASPAPTDRVRPHAHLRRTRSFGHAPRRSGGWYTKCSHRRREIEWMGSLATQEKSHDRSRNPARCIHRRAAR
jgi:hypothetical protein